MTTDELARTVTAEQVWFAVRHFTNGYAVDYAARIAETSFTQAGQLEGEYWRSAEAAIRLYGAVRARDAVDDTVEIDNVGRIEPCATPFVAEIATILEEHEGLRALVGAAPGVQSET